MAVFAFDESVKVSHSIIPRFGDIIARFLKDLN